MTIDDFADTDLSELGISVPAWIEPGQTPSDLEAIAYGGCASGAYMPAVTYTAANATMAEHGDDVLEYIDQRHGDEYPAPDLAGSWSMIASHYLAGAVELWAQDAIHELCNSDEYGELAAEFFHRVY